MALPSAITNFTSPILENALETGARGQTVTHTNYGVIGDAMFKKAQLDLGIANLQVDMGIKKAQILGGLEMDRARLQLDNANTMMQAAQIADQQRAQDVSDTEMVLGTLQGAITGGMAGFALGGPGGAVAGAAAGGAMAYGGYSQGRQEGQMAVQTTGLISNAAVAIKGFSDNKAKMDGAKAALGTIDYFQQQMASAENPADFNAARAGYEKAVAGMSNGLVKAGWGIDEAAAFTADYGKSQQGIFSTDAEAYNKAKIDKFGELMRNDKILNSNLPQSYKDSRMKELFSGIDSSVSQLNNYDPNKSFSADHAMSFAQAHGQGTNAASLFNPKTPVVSNSIGAVSSVARTTRAAPSPGGRMQAQVVNPADTQDSTDITPTNFQASGAPMEGGIPFAPSNNAPAVIDSSPGVRMFSQPVQAEQELAKMGADTVDKLKLNEGNAPVQRQAGKSEDEIQRQQAEIKEAKAGQFDMNDKFDQAAQKRIGQIKGEKEKQIAAVAYKSTDQLAILDAIGYDQMEFPMTEAGEAKRNKIEGLAGANAKVNIIKEQAKDFEAGVREALKANGVPEEELDQEMRNFYLGLDMYDQGMGSKTEDLAMKGSGFGFTLAADMNPIPVKGQIGGQGQKFEKNRKLQMEGRGDTQFMGKTPPELRQRIKDTFNGMVTNMDTFAAEMATGTMKGTLSERDIGMYAVKNPADLSYNTISAKLAEHQTTIVNKLMIASKGTTKAGSRKDELEMESMKAQIRANASLGTHAQKLQMNQAAKQRPSWLETLQYARRP